MLTSTVVTRLEKAAVDNGFDRELPRQGDWLGFASTQVPLQIWLTAAREERFVAAVSQQSVARTLADQGAPVTDVLPSGATGALAVAELLRASHIKPWAACDTDAERLDVFNGLLLAPNLDAAFDRGFITVAENGDVLVSERVGDPDRLALGLDVPLCLSSLDDGHQTYLRFHRERVFKDSSGPADN